MTEINAINIFMLLFINSRLVLRYRNRLTISLVLICRLIVVIVGDRNQVQAKTELNL